MRKKAVVSSALYKVTSLLALQSSGFMAWIYVHIPQSKANSEKNTREALGAVPEKEDKEGKKEEALRMDLRKKPQFYNTLMLRAA